MLFSTHFEFTAVSMTMFVFVRENEIERSQEGLRELRGICLRKDLINFRKVSVISW